MRPNIDSAQKTGQTGHVLPVRAVHNPIIDTEVDICIYSTQLPIIPDAFVVRVHSFLGVRITYTYAYCIQIFFVSQVQRVYVQWYTVVRYCTVIVSYSTN